jgi:hypothetical protein
LRDMQSCCRAAKVEFFRDDQEVAQMAKFHSNSFYHLVRCFYILDSIIHGRHPYDKARHHERTEHALADERH